MATCRWDRRLVNHYSAPSSRLSSIRFHYHLVVIDGAFSQAPDGEGPFREAALLQPHYRLELQGVVQRHVLRYLDTTASSGRRYG